MNVPSLYHTISKKQGRFVKFLPRKKKTVKMSQKPEKHWKKQGLSAVRDIELHMRTMGGNERSQTVYTNGQRKSKIAIDIGKDRAILQSNKG